MNKQKTDIKGLVTSAASGDQDAWEGLYNATFREAYFVAVKVAGCEQDASDLVHDAYVTAIQKIGELEKAESFQSWLNIVVANKCRDYLRKKKPVLFSELQSDDGSEPDWIDDRDEVQPEIIFDQDETVRMIAEMIEDLPEDQRLCVMLYYRDELSISQIAKILELSEGTVKSRLTYARSKVKDKVKQLEKQGIKLYGIAPLPLLIWLLKHEKASTSVPATALKAPAVHVAAVTATSSVATQTAAAGSTGIITKVLAGIVAVSIVTGGVATFHSAQRQEDATIPVALTAETTATPEVTTLVTEPLGQLENLNILEQTLDFSKAWAILEDIEGYTYKTTYIFEPDGTCYSLIGINYSEIDYFCQGTYCVEGENVTFDIVLGNRPKNYSYRFDSQTLQFTQISEAGLFADHCFGDVFQLQVDEFFDAQEAKNTFTQFSHVDTSNIGG